MAYWNKELNGFQPNNNEAGTLIEYTDEQINEMFASGNVVTGEDGLPTVVPRAEPTEEDRQAQYEGRVDGLIRSKYTLSQELALIRQQATKSEEYEVYFDYCEECKRQVRLEVYGDEV